MQQSPITLGKWNSVQKSSGWLSCDPPSIPTCKRGVSYRLGNIYRLGLSETSNLTGFERKINFVFLREATSLSQSNQLLSINSSAENPEPEVLSRRALNGDKNGGNLDELNEISRLSDLMQKNGRHSIQSGMEIEEFSHF